MIKNLPTNFLDQYLNKEINNYFDKEIIEPKQISLEYSNNENQNEIINIYKDFDIIDYKLLKLFIEKYNNNNILVKGFFKCGFIIINIILKFILF